MAAIRARVMDGSLHHRGIVSPVFHDINFTTGRPAAVGRMFGHQPKRRPITLTLRQFGAEFEATICLAEQSQRLQSSGGVVLPSVRLFFDLTPAMMISGVELPMIRINRDAVEFVAPNQLPIPSRGEGSQRDRRASHPRAQSSGANQ